MPYVMPYDGRADARVRHGAVARRDERHLRAVTPLHGGAFTLLPADL